jgi:epoxyqueuosine reductase
VTAPSFSPRRLAAWCTEAGFAASAFLRTESLPGALRRHPEVASLGRGTFVLVALSCHRREPEDLSAPGDPHGLIAPFARRNYYREAVLRLRQVARLLGAATGLARRELRLFSNSRLPEKPLAAAAGLGSYGRNGLILSPPLGSLFVIAGMFLPLPPEEDAGAAAWLPRRRGRLERSGAAGSPGRPGRAGSAGGLGGPGGPAALCGSCRACQEACPVGALSRVGRLDTSRCLQALAGRAVELPAAAREAWGFRLYGCQVCQEVCPWNRGLSREAPAACGELGPSLSLRRVLERDPEELARAWRPTALGMPWIDKRALLRNALVAAGHRGDPALRESLQAWAQRPDPLLRGAALWALERLGARHEGTQP